VRGHNGSLKESSLPSLQFFSYLWFFFLFFLFFFLLEKKKMPRKSVWNKRVKVGRQKREPKLRRPLGSLKEGSFLSLHFFSSL
jgi:hypothetical protein